MAPVRLLLVDDDESVLSGLSVILEAHEFEVTTASGVNEALQHISSASFDVLLTDLHMPGPGDGLIVVGAMRHANPRAVTLVLSANPDMVKATTAVLRQVDEVLLKPVKAGPIVEAIQRRLAEEETFPLPQLLQAEAEVEAEPPLRPQAVELVATLLERERASITLEWLLKMKDAVNFAAVAADGGAADRGPAGDVERDYLPVALFAAVGVDDAVLDGVAAAWGTAAAAGVPLPGAGGGGAGAAGGAVPGDSGQPWAHRPEPVAGNADGDCR